MPPETTKEILNLRIWYSPDYNNFLLAWETKCSMCVAYGLLSYVTALLKTYYPTEFFCALFINEKGNFEKLGKYISEAKKMNINLYPPSINHSKDTFSVFDKSSILFGLSEMKGVSQSSISDIINNRPYISLTDFLDKTQESSLNITTKIALIKGGCFDEFNKNREDLLLELAKYTFIPLKEKTNKSINKKQRDFLLENNIITLEQYSDKKNKDFWLEQYNEYKLAETKDKNEKRLKKHIAEFKEKYFVGSISDWEFEIISTYLTTDPYVIAKQELQKIDEIQNHSKALIAGTIVDIKYKSDKNNRKYCYIDLLNHEGRLIECICWASTYERYQNFVKKRNKIITQATKKENKLFMHHLKEYENWEALYL